MKITATLVIVLGIIFALSSVGATISYYNNINVSANNSLNSTILNLGVSASDFVPPDIAAGESAQKPATVSNLGGIDFQYSVESGNFTGDNTLCNALDLTATLDGKNVFTGKLTNFISSATTTHYSWLFSVALPANSLVGVATCNFDFVFKAWQTNVSTYNDSGYRDTETIQNIISSHEVEIIPPPPPGEDDNEDDNDEQEHQDNHENQDQTENNQSGGSQE